MVVKAAKRVDASTLRKLLRKIQEPKGYLFNADDETADELLDGLLANREHYGYMSCSCRFASGDRERDRDIICPCIYCVPDVAEYGSCYCGLFVSRDWNERKVPHVRIPERRPPEKSQEAAFHSQPGRRPRVERSQAHDSDAAEEDVADDLLILLEGPPR